MLSQLDKLSEENFHTWKSGMTMFLTAAGASWFLEEKDSVVPSHLKEKDQHLLFYIWASIKSGVGPRPQGHIADNAKR